MVLLFVQSVFKLCLTCICAETCWGMPSFTSGAFPCNLCIIQGISPLCGEMPCSKFGADILLSQVLLAWVEVTECSVPASPVPIPALNPPVEVSHGSCLSLQAVLAQVRDWHSSSLAVPLLQPLRTESSISLKEKEKLLLLFPL